MLRVERVVLAVDVLADGPPEPLVLGVSSIEPGRTRYSKVSSCSRWKRQPRSAAAIQSSQSSQTDAPGS